MDPLDLEQNSPDAISDSQSVQLSVPDSVDEDLSLGWADNVTISDAARQACPRAVPSRLRKYWLDAPERTCSHVLDNQYSENSVRLSFCSHG
jgi:hypothetical protein